MDTNTVFTSKSTGESYRIRNRITCQSVNAVYLISCRVCGIQYVGQTSTTINTRIRNHLYDILHGNIEKPVARHFTSPGHNADDVTVIGIATNVNNINRRLRTEDSWIRILRTRQPEGLNLIS